MHLVTTEEAAAIAGLNPATLRKMRQRAPRRGKSFPVEPVMRAGNSLLYDRAAVVAWAAERAPTPPHLIAKCARARAVQAERRREARS